MERGGEGEKRIGGGRRGTEEGGWERGMRKGREGNK